MKKLAVTDSAENLIIARSINSRGVPAVLDENEIFRGNR